MSWESSHQISWVFSSNLTPCLSWGSKLSPLKVDKKFLISKRDPFQGGNLDVSLTVYSWYLLCSLGILGDYNSNPISTNYPLISHLTPGLPLLLVGWRHQRDWKWKNHLKQLEPPVSLLDIGSSIWACRHFFGAMGSGDYWGPDGTGFVKNKTNATFI